MWRWATLSPIKTGKLGGRVCRRISYTLPLVIPAKAGIQPANFQQRELVRRRPSKHNARHGFRNQRQRDG